MTTPLEVAMFVGSFPIVSETFILRQITGLLDRGHRVDIYADLRDASNAPLQPEIANYGLLDRATFMDLPEECAPWELPIRPFTGKSWVPGSEQPISNFARLRRALPLLASAYLRSPRLTRQLLDSAEYGYYAASFSSIYRLAKLAAVHKTYDIVHAHFGPIANRFRFAKQLWKVPLVVSFYGYDFSVVPRKEGSAVYDRLFRTADRVIAISEHVRNELRKLGAPDHKLSVIPLGVSLNQFPFAERKPPAGPIKILTVARLVEKKGLEESLRAFSCIRSQFSHPEYHIIGDGALRPALVRLAAQLGIAEAVHFHGAQDAQVVRAKMAEAHLFVLASVTAADGDQEGQGLVLAEAQASGLPVIATAHAAFPESIAVGQSGFLVPERDVKALAARIAEVLSAPESWGHMGRAGRAFVEHKFDAGRLNENLEALYQEVIESCHA